MQNLLTMGVNALEINPAETFTSFGEALKYSLGTAVFGLAVVFGVLALLWGVLEIFKVVFYTIPNKKKEASVPEKKEAPAPKPEVPVPEISEQETVSALGDEELTAVITAAVMAFRSAQGAVGGFRVVSFKKR